MSTGRVSRIQRRYEENIAKNNQRNYSNNNNYNQRRNNNNNNSNYNNRRQANNNNNNNNNNGNNWIARPVQGLTTLVTQTVPKAATFAWTQCTNDTTWEEFDFGNNPFKGGGLFGGGNNDAHQDFMGDVLDDFNDIVERDPFQFDIKPNQPLSRRHREEEDQVPQTGWANFNAFPQYQPYEVLQAVRFNSYTTPSTASITTGGDDDTFFDHGEKMFNVKAIPITEVIPIESVTPIPEEDPRGLEFELPHQMSDPSEAGGDYEQDTNSRTKSARFRPFGGKSKKVQVTVGLPSLKVKSVQDESSTPIRGNKASDSSSSFPSISKEEERFRKEEQRLKEMEKEEEERIFRLKEERLRLEEERLQRERERILEEEERIMREEEERERRREERLRREEEMLRQREERKERELRQQEERDFARIEQQTRQKKSSDDPFLDFEDIDIEANDSQEVDWQGFPPSVSSKRSRQQRSRYDDRDNRSYRSSEKRRDHRRDRDDKEESDDCCATCCPSSSSCCCECACCPPFYHRHKIWINIVIVLILLAGLSIGIYAAIAGPDAFGGSEDGTTDECQAVLKGFSVASEALYPVVRLSWVMDISTARQSETLPQLTKIVGSQFQDLVIPTLAGCIYGAPGVNDYSMERFDIVNGYVRSVRDVGSCRYGEVQPCARVLVDFVLFVRGEAPVLDLIAHISSTYTAAVVDAMEQLVNVRKAGLVGLFEQRT